MRVAFIGILFLILTVALVASRTKSTARKVDLPYQKRRYFFSRAEQRFYDHLTKAIRLAGPNLIVFAKVRMSDLLIMRKGTVGRDYWAAWGRISQKHADFVLVRPRQTPGEADALEPILVIELDDSSHDQPHRTERDALVDAIYVKACLPVLHIPVTYTYDVRELATRIRGVLSIPEFSLPPNAPGTGVN